MPGRDVENGSRTRLRSDPQCPALSALLNSPKRPQAPETTGSRGNLLRQGYGGHEPARLRSRTRLRSDPTIRIRLWLCTEPGFYRVTRQVVGPSIPFYRISNPPIIPGGLPEWSGSSKHLIHRTSTPAFETTPGTDKIFHAPADHWPRDQVKVIRHDHPLLEGQILAIVSLQIGHHLPGSGIALERAKPITPIQSVFQNRKMSTSVTLRFFRSSLNPLERRPDFPQLRLHGFRQRSPATQGDRITTEIHHPMRMGVSMNTEKRALPRRLATRDHCSTPVCSHPHAKAKSTGMSKGKLLREGYGGHEPARLRIRTRLRSDPKCLEISALLNSPKRRQAPETAGSRGKPARLRNSTR